MAISHIGTEFAHNAAGGTVEDVVVDVPAGVADGDYMVLLAYGPQPPAIGPITGWTNIDANNASTVLKVNIYHRIASSEPANYTVPSTTSDIRGSSITVLRGVDTTSLTTALDANSVNVNITSGDPISADTVTIGTTGSVVLTARGTRGSSAVQCRHSSSDTELADFGADNGTTTRDGVVYLSGVKTVGSTPALSISLTGGAGTHSVTYALAIAPPVEPPAGHAAVTATANAPTTTKASRPPAGHAAVTATANNPTVSTATNRNAPAGHAAVTATANAPTATKASRPSAGHAAATATANAATTDRDDTVNAAGHAAVTATANQPVVNTSGNTNAPAGHAAATTTANAPTAQTSSNETAPAGHTGATATANAATVTTGSNDVNANAGHASVTTFVPPAATTAPEPPEEILPTNADWNIWIDWDKDLGVNLTSFETGTTEGWEGLGNPPALLIVDLEAPSQPVKHGRRSMRVEWQIDTNPVTTPFTFGDSAADFDTGSFNVNDPPVEGPFVSPTVERILTGLVVGRTYTAKAWFYVPTNSPDVRLQCNATNGSFTTLLDQWVEASVTFAATATTHTLVIDPETDPNATTDHLFVESVTLTHTTEPVDPRVFGTRQSLSFKYGRDTARALEAMSPTECTFELDNEDLELSPDNPASIFNPYLIPGRPIYVRADWDNRFYSMFYGFIESYTLKPGIGEDSVEFGAQDMLSQLADFELDTHVVASGQTGELINVVLDEMGWPEHRRQIDHGATTVSWWHETGTDALEAVKKLVDSEGLPAFAYVDRHGNFVFRDRHHRYLDPRSLAPQATFYSGSTDEEPQFCEPFEYDLGWTDLINQVDFEIEIRQPRPMTTVFTQDEEQVIQLKSGEAFVLDVEANEPFIDALDLVKGTVVVTDTASAGEAGEEEEEVFSPTQADFIVRTGTSNVSAVLSRRSGATCKITFTASGGDATISNVRLRARPIEVVQTLRVKAEDPASVSEHGPRAYDGEVPWANPHDADAVGRIIVGSRGERLPVVSFTVNSGNETRYLQVLERDLSDRIHLIERKTFNDHDYFIESIEHNIDEVGWDHRATFACERIRELPVVNVFEFGDANAGFDEGSFGGIGFVTPDTQFVLGASQLNVDKLTM